MDELMISNPEEDKPITLSARQAATVIFRHRRLSIIGAAAVVLAIVLGAIVLPKYQSEMKILVKRGRVDPVVTSSETNDRQTQIINSAITEEELNSEVEVLTSDDLLRQVVLANHLQDGVHNWFDRSEEGQIQEATRQLKNHLNVESVKKANVITASYKSKDPQLAYSILKSLSTLYLQKHTLVHRPPGEFQFFEKETEQSRKQLQDAEARLKQFPQQEGAVAPQLERDITLQKLNEFNFVLEQTRADIRASQDRIRELQGLETSTPQRMMTQLRRSDNGQLMQQLKSTLLELELKRTELLTKFQPDYRPVQEVEKQIAETKAAIQAENDRPIREETTDQNPTHEWVRGELAKAEADLASQQARATATQRIVAEYQNRAKELGDKAIMLGDLQRNQKVQEDNYLLYLRKSEEARINSALDQNRILNVALAEDPAVPALPAHPRWLYAMASGLLMMVFCAGTVYLVDRSDMTFRTPDEVRQYLAIPVLAALPAPNDDFGRYRGDAPKRGLFGATAQPESGDDFVTTLPDARE